MKHFIVRLPATEQTIERFWWGCTGPQAAEMADKGYDVREADYLQQPWEMMKKPKKIIDYGFMKLLSF